MFGVNIRNYFLGPPRQHSILKIGPNYMLIMIVYLSGLGGGGNFS